MHPTVDNDLVVLYFSLVVGTLFCGIQADTVTQKPQWGYDEKVAGGPDQWHHHDEDCAGRFQSPIALWQEDLSIDNDLPAFELIGYDKELYGLQMENNGHTVKIEFDPKQHGLRIRGGGLQNGTFYRLAQFHFHWGATDEVGSEHMLGDHYYPFELHLVHIKEPLTLAQALKDPQGLAVLGVLFEHNDLDNNTALIPLIEVMNHVVDKGGKVRLRRPIKARDLLPLDVSNFFRYQGSLTTPPCSEVVTWTVFVDAHPITTAQIEKFRRVRKHDYLPSDADEPDLEGRLLFNHRPVQPLYNRKVAVRKHLKCSLPTRSSASSLSACTRIIFSILSLIVGFMKF